MMPTNGAKNVQLQWFTFGGNEPRADQIFECLLGDEPESVQKNKLPSPQKPFLSQASATSDETTLLVQVLPGRVILSALPIELGIESDKPPLLSSSNAMTFLEKSITSIPNDNLIEAYRVAVNCEFLDVFESLEEANDCAFAYCEVSAPNNIQDFRYQANARRSFKDGIDINRIFAYSVQNYELLDMQFGAQMPGMFSAPVRRTWQTTALTIDLNTVPTQHKLPDQKELFFHLFDQMQYLASKKTVGALYE